MVSNLQSPQSDSTPWTLTLPRGLPFVLIGLQFGSEMTCLLLRIFFTPVSAIFMIALDTNGVKGEFFFMYIDKYIKGVGLFHTDVI